MHSSLCHFHLRLLLFHFLFVAFTSYCCFFAFSLPNVFVFLSLLPPTVALSLSLRRFRLNGGFGEGFRRNAFDVPAPSPFLCLSRSQRSLPIMSPSLYTEWRLCSKLSKEAIMLLFPLLLCLRRSHRSLLTVSLSLSLRFRFASLRFASASTYD
jgi:hypothetical protein